MAKEIEAYRVSYPPFQAAISEDQSITTEFVSLKSYIATLDYRGPRKERKILTQLVSLLGPHIYIQNETAIPLIRQSGELLQSPITQLLFYWFGIRFTGFDSASDRKPPDANAFRRVTQTARVPARFFRLIEKQGIHIN